MEAYLIGVGVPALSALTYVAYKHPDAYDKLKLILFILLAVVFALMVGALAGSMATYDSVSSYIELTKATKALAVHDAVGNSLFLAMAVTILSFFYLTFLASFPMLFGRKPRHEEPPGKTEGED